MTILLEKMSMDKLKGNDLNVSLSGAFIIHTQFWKLVELRSELERLFGKELIYHSFSSQTLFVVHKNDLSEDKKEALNKQKIE